MHVAQVLFVRVDAQGLQFVEHGLVIAYDVVTRPC